MICRALSDPDSGSNNKSMPDFPAGITVTGVTCDEVTASGRPVSKSLRSNLAPPGSSVIEKEAFGSNVPLLVAGGYPE